MRPRDPRYNAIPLPEAPKLDAKVAFIATRSPISNTFARYQNAEDKKRDGMVTNNKTFFNPWETIHESNPQEILERHEKVDLVPLLIMQGALDDNVMPPVQEKFAQTYKAAGGDIEFHVFEGSEHEWVAKEGPQTDKGPRDGQGVHRAPVEGVTTRASARALARASRAGAWLVIRCETV